MTVDFESTPKHLRYLQAAARVLTRTDRILSGQEHLQVQIEEQGPAIAWTDGMVIALRSKDWEGSYGDTEATNRLLGLNYHELSHVLFTPRDGDRAYTMVRNAQADRPGLMMIFNAAEDQRIETLFTTLYRPSVPLFTQAVLDLIVVDGQSAETSWMLIAGRRYLPDKLRAMSRAAYQADAAEWEVLISDYLTIEWNDDAARGVQLLEQMYDHLDRNQLQAPDGCGTPAPSRGKPDAEAQEQAAEAVAQDIADEQGEDEEPEADGANAEDEDNGTEEESQQEPQDGPSEDIEDADGPETPEDGPEGQEGTSEDKGEQSGDFDDNSEDAPSDEDWEQALDEATDDAESQARAEVASVEVQIDAEMDQSDVPMGSHFPKHDGRVPVTDAARSLSHELEGVLSELRTETDPGWLSHRPAGRINARRYMGRQPWEDLDEVFDEWNQGAEEALDIEVAILVDTSSSMYGKESLQVAECSWALKRALGNHNIPVAVLAFDSKSATIYGPDEEADDGWMPRPLARNMTSPGEALVEVGRHFNYSTHRRRILVVLTDGAFTASYRTPDGRSFKIDEIVRSIDAEVRVLLRYGIENRHTWGFDEIQQIAEIDQMVDACREAIVEGVKRTGIQEVVWS